METMLPPRYNMKKCIVIFFLITDKRMVIYEQHKDAPYIEQVSENVDKYSDKNSDKFEINMTTTGTSSSSSSSSSSITNVQLLQTLTVYTSDVTSVDFAGDCLLVTGSGDKRVRVWEWRMGRGYVEACFSPLQGHKYGVTSVKVSPRSTMLASASIDGTTLLWNLRTGTKIHTLVQVGGEAVRVCRFSPDSTILATAGDNGQVCLWDLIRRNLIRSFQKHDGAVQSLCFSPDSNWLITTCTFAVLKLFSTADLIDSCVSDNRTINAFASVDDAHDLGVVSCDFAASQEITNNEPFTKLYRLVTCGNDCYVKLWQISVIQVKCEARPFVVKIELCRIMEKHSSALTCVRFSANGLYIASSGLDKRAVIWEACSGKLLEIMSGHNRYIACCAFSRDGNLLATGSNDKSVIIWDLTGNFCLDSELARHHHHHHHHHHHSTTLALRFLQNNQVEQSAAYEQSVMTNAETSINNVRLIKKLEEHTGAVNSVAFYKNHLIASGSGDKLIRVWNIEIEEDQDSEITMKFHEKPYSPLDGHKYSINHVEFSPCGNMLASCSLDGTAIIWNTESGCRAKSSFVNSGSGIRVCRWSPDGTKIATAGDDERTTLWDMNTMEELCVFSGHSDAVNAIAFTHDSRYLVAASNEGTWILFDAIGDKNCTALMICEGAHDLGVQGCDFSPTSDFITIRNKTGINNDKQFYLLATGGNDSLVKLWRVTTSTKANRNNTTGGNGSGDNDLQYREEKSLAGHGGNVTCVRFSPLQSEILGSVATDRTARIWSVYSGACLYVLEEHESLVTTCAFSEDTSLFITGALDKTVLIWRIPRQLISQNILMDNLKYNRRKAADWRVNDTMKWLNEVGLSTLARKAYTVSLTGRQLLSLSEDELTNKLLLVDEDDQTIDSFKTQLYWLKREENGNTIEIPADDTAAAAAAAAAAEVPHEFLCPITHEIMREPVRCSDGFTYEKAAINEWFLCGKYTSPMTNESLRDTSFTPNVVLRNLIYTFLHGRRPQL